MCIWDAPIALFDVYMGRTNSIVWCVYKHLLCCWKQCVAWLHALKHNPRVKHSEWLEYCRIIHINSEGAWSMSLLRPTHLKDTSSSCRIGGFNFCTSGKWKTTTVSFSTAWSCGLNKLNILIYLKSHNRQEKASFDIAIQNYKRKQYFKNFWELTENKMETNELINKKNA